MTTRGKGGEIPPPRRCVVNLVGQEKGELNMIVQEREWQLDRRHLERGCRKFEDLDITYGVVYANGRAYKASVNPHGFWEARRDRRFDNKKEA